MPAGDGHRNMTRLRLGLSILAIVAIIISANLAGAWLVDLLKIELTPSNEHFIHQVIMVSVIMYAFMIAIPFVPGIEIGLALLVMVGPDIAVLVYGCTVLGLFVSFLIGYFIPQAWLKLGLQTLHLQRVSRLVGRMEHLGTKERLAFLVSRAPSRTIPFFVRHRYIALAVVLNIPGNALIGGGGGISIAAGLSKLYSPPAFLATLALAVAPVPLAVLVFGQKVLLP